MRKIKIAMVSQSLNIGGGETMAAKFASFIDPKKFDVKLFIIGNYQDNQLSAYLNSNNVDYVCLNQPTSGISFASYRIFASALSSFSPDIVHVHLDVSYSWIWSLLHNKPLVATIHGDPYVQPVDKRARILTKLKSFQRNLKMVGCARIVSEHVIEKYNVQDSCLETIYNPIETDTFCHIDDREDEQVKIFHAGRFHPLKNHKMLVGAFDKIVQLYPYCHLYLAGTGELLEEVQSQVKELKISENVHFLGNVQNIAEIISRMDMFALSSISEACPMVILEAMAASLPVVATDVGGVKELVDGNGFLVKSQDENDMADKLMLLVKNEEMRRKMGNRSKELSQKYDKEFIVRQYESIYCAMVKKNV